MVRKKKLLIGMISVFMIGITLYNKPLSRIINVESRIYGTPANSSFTDENFYKCVVDAYNKENNTSLGYNVSLTDEQLASITELTCSNSNVVDTTGIEKMVGLEKLDLKSNEIKNIDLSHNTALTRLELYKNQVTCLDLSNNDKLEYAWLSDNKLSSVIIGENNFLTSLFLDYNELTNIDLSSATSLEYLSLLSNKLSDLDLKNNTSLINLNLNGNELSDIDLGQNTALEKLNLSGNKLTDIDLSKNVDLINLTIISSELINIDLSSNTNLRELDLSHNKLSGLDLSNNIDLRELHLNNNSLSELNLSQNTSLYLLDLGNNQLENINLSNNTGLKNLNLESNQISNIELSNNKLLTHLNLDNNNLTSLNLSNNKDLIVLRANSNKIESINLNNSYDLKTLYLRDNLISNIDLSRNADILNISLSNNKISTIDLSNNIKLDWLDLSENKIINTDLSNNILLTELYLGNNLLTEIDLSNNINLEALDIGGNQLTSLDLSNNTLIRNLYQIRSEKQLVIYENDLLGIEDMLLLNLINENGIKNQYLTTYTYTSVDGSEKNFNFYYLIKWIKSASSKYTINNDNYYIYTGHDTNVETILQNINLTGSNDVMGYIENNKYIIKYNDEVVKEFDIVNISSDKYDLTKSYLSGSLSDITNNVNVVNGSIGLNLITNKIEIKYNDDVLQEFGYVNYTSEKYDLSKNYIKVNDDNIQSLLNSINCTNCSVYVYDGTDNLTTGEFGDNQSLRIMYNDEVVKEYDLKYSASGVDLNKNELKLNLDTKKAYQLSADVIPVSAENKNVTWESSNPSIATVDENGLVTAKSYGETTITVKTEDGEFTDTCNVVVSEITTYTVTFKDGDNTYTSEFEENEDIVFKTDLEKTGYKLVGWKYNNQNYSLIDKLVMPGNDIELEAIWELVIPKIENYESDDNNITGISLKTNVDSLDLGVDSIYQVKVSKHDGSDKTSGLVGTGDKVKIYLDNQLVSEYDLIIKGDVTGTGTSTVSDVAKLYQYLKGKVKMDDCYVKAGNVVDSDSTIKVNDVAKLYQFIKGKINSI